MICFGFHSLDFGSNFWSWNIRRDFLFFKDALNQSDFCDKRLKYRDFFAKITLNQSIPKDALNQSDFCDKRLKYRDFCRKNNLKSEYTYYSSMFVVM